MSAPVCVFFRRIPQVTGFIAIAIAWFAFASSISILTHVLDVGVITYELGNWAPPWGIEYRIDPRQRLCHGDRVRRRGRRGALMPRTSIRTEIAGFQIYLFNRDVPAVPDRPARHRDHG